MTAALALGINAPWDTDGINKCAQMGFTHARIGWESTWINTTDYTKIARIISDIHNAGMKVVLCLTPGTRAYDEPGFVPWVMRMVGYLSDDDIVEVHNEPNHQPFAKVPDAKAYAAEFCAVYSAVKAGRPRIKVIIGGMSPESGALDPRQFTVDCINGAPTVMVGATAVSRFLKNDGVGMHTYEFPYEPDNFDPHHPWNPCAYLTTLDAIWRFCGVAAQDFYLTEFGAPSGGGSSPNGQPYTWDQTGQAAWLARYAHAFSMSPAHIALAVYYNYQDGNPGTGAGWEPFTGVVTSTRSPKRITPAITTWAWAIRK